MGVLDSGLKGARALLDMSRKARMERAREMGFDTERVLFHGSPTLDESGAFDASFPRRTDEGYMGVGAYVTPKRFIADAYAGRDGNTLELLSRSSRPLTVPYDESYRQRLKDIADGWGVDVQDIDSAEWAQEFRARAIENGYDSVVGVAPDTGEAIEMVVYDPAMLRSVNAAFDPAKRDSSNLLAGVGGAAVGAGILGAGVAPQEADAAPFGTLARQLGKRTREAWHGSPHVYDQVDLSRMGSGEGQQVFGAGFYAADARTVAEGYRRDLTLRGLAEQGPDGRLAAEVLKNFDWDVEDALASLKRSGEGSAAEALEAAIKDGGALYRLEIPGEEMLDFDVELSDLPENVKDSLATVIDQFPSNKAEWSRALSGELTDYERDWSPTTGRALYMRMASEVGPERASQMLSEAGIPGIRYLDGVSRNAGEGTRNYVIFDDRNVNVVERNGEPIAAMPRGREEPMSAAAGFARPGMMAAAGAGGAVAYDPVEARRTAQRRQAVDAEAERRIAEFEASASAPRPSEPLYPALARLAELAGSQRTDIPLYGKPLESTATTLDRLAYGDYRPGRTGLAELGFDAVTAAAEVFDPLTWFFIDSQRGQDAVSPRR